jgi:hypothetical protein
MVFFFTLPAYFMLFFYLYGLFMGICPDVFKIYITELMWCSFIEQKKNNPVRQFWCIQNSLVDFSLQIFFLHILFMIKFYVQAVWMEVLKFDPKMVPLQKNWQCS